MINPMSELSAGAIAGLGPTAVPNIEAARSWKVQVMAAYALLYPLIAKDFRHILDCDECHTLLSASYQGDGHGKHCRHTFKQNAKDIYARMLVAKGIGPFGAQIKDASILKAIGFSLFGINIDDLSDLYV